jgi:hypothetical protein
MNKDKAPEAELYQENTCPVQFFSSPAVPVTSDTPLEPRHGRPVHRQQEGNGKTTPQEKLPAEKPACDD